MGLRQFLKNEGEKILQIVIISFFALLTLVVFTAPFSNLDTDSISESGEEVPGEKFTYSINNTQKWFEGWNGGVDVTSEGIKISEGRTDEDIVHTVAIRAYDVEEVYIWADIPEDTEVNAEIRVSSNEEFSSRGEYIRKGEKNFGKLSEGKNSFEIPEFENNYYRIYFELNRQDEITESPLVKNTTVKGTAIEGTSLIHTYN